MIVNINQDWRLRSDAFQWFLDHRVKSKWRVAGRSLFLDEIMMEMARREIRLMREEYPADALAFIAETLDQIREDCRKAVREAITKARTSGEAPEVKVI